MNIKFFNAAKRDAVTRFLAPVAVAFFSVFLASCPNSADNVPFVLPAQQTVSSAPTVSAGGTAANAEAQFITFRGSVRTGGALPASYAKALEGLGFGGTEESVEGLSKSARPEVNADGISIEHFAVATPNSGEPVEGTFASASSTTFEMPLAIGKTWNIVCGIRNVSGDKKIIMSDSFQMEVTVSNSALSHVFMLTPYTEVVEGVAPSGNVSLLVNFEGSAASDGASVSASWEDPALPALTVEGLDPALITASGVPVGNHRLAIFFRDPNGVSVYETVQVVTVLNGLTTETWMPETGEAAFTSGGHFVVDNDVIQGAASDRIYVGKPAALASNDSVRASDSNSGSAYSPLEHLQAAFNKIQSAGSGSKDFKIFVSGEAVGNATLDVVKDVSARSITIEGLDDLDESLKPKSALKGSGSGSVFTIASNVPVTIKNLKITGGSGAGQGGGISMASGSDLTLDSGALVTQNSATQQGGGVYNRDGSLKIKKGAAISGNWITSAGASGSDGGAGLFMYGSSAACVMTGGEISDNNKNSSYNSKLVRGGGVRLGGSARMTLSGGSVSGNFSKNLGGNFFIDNAFLDISGDAKICQGRVDTSSNTSDDNAWGGALYVEGNSKVTMTGGEISGNTAKAKSSKFACAGVYLLKEFEMTGGVIEGNVVEGGLSSGGAFRVGGLLTIGGSAKIPYGGGEGKNDVYVCKDGEAYKVVQVAASGFSYAASDSAPAAVLAPEGWQRNYAIIKAPSGSDIGAYTPYFKTIYPDFYFGKLSGTVDTAKLKAALCVSNKASAADNDEQSGTKSQPFRTIEFALTKLSAGEPDEIIIDYDSNGAAFGPQKIPSSFIPAKCSALTIRGANGLYTSGANQGEPKDILDAGGTENVGSALSIASAVPITIKDLKITGGNKGYISGDNPNSGGGVSLFENASLTLADGVQIAGNKASNSGGGVYVPSGASLYMYGTSCIGDNTQTTASGDALGSACSNSAPYGGGIYNDGRVYLGYKNEGGEIKEAEWTGGVRRNYASTNGGGIYCGSNGDLKMRAGKISYNASHYSYWGGGLSVASNASNGHSVELLGGEIKENSAGLGGAVYVNGAFSMQGALSIPFGVAGAKVSGKNDIFLKAGQTVEVADDLTLPDGESTVATLMPEGAKRKRKILSASSADLINGNKDKFALVSDNAGWQKNYVSDSGHYAELNSPVYVVGTKSSGSTKPDDKWGWGNLYNAPNGTKTSPYASVEAALGCAELASATEPNTIIIAGTLKGAQSISGTSVPSDLSLKGYKTATSSSMIDAGGTTDAGSALTVNKSGLAVTITDLTITGGSGSSMTVDGAAQTNGGGILLNAGSVKLSDGAVITGNTVADNGGGVYLAASGCALYMSGKALIGDSATSTTRASSAASNRANQAKNGAGIYNNGGAVYIGYDTSSHKESVYSDTSSSTKVWYGVRRNFCTSGGSGAGIYHASGTLKIASGDISHNNAGNAQQASYSGGGIYCAADATISGGTFTNNYANHGGALYIAESKKVTIDGSAVFTKNGANSSGGAICNYGELTMSAGTIGGSSSDDLNKVTINDVVTSTGGAIHQAGTFSMSGSAYIAPGSEKTNDVYLPYAKTVTVASTTLSGSTSSVATVTPANWSRGTNIIEWGVSPLPAQKTTIKGQIQLSKDNTGWERDDITSGGKNYTYITSPIYVADATSPLSGFGAGKTKADGGNGTKSSPYNSIEEALKDSDLASVKKIKIAGTVKGAQTISGTLSTDTLTIEGYTEGGVTSSLNGGFSSSKNGRPLTVSSAATVTIQNLAITGGYASGSTDESKRGGGVYVKSGAAVNLADGAVVKGNYADNEGGGVYVESGAYFAAYGTSVIGNSSATAPNYSAELSAGTNRAKKGAGVYNAGGTLCFGKSINKSGTESGTASWSGGLLGNTSFGSGDGAAIWTSGATKLYDGNIKFNYSLGSGGAIFIAENTSSVTMSGGTIFKNTAYNNGGAVYISSGATFNMSGGTIGGKDASNNAVPNIVTNYSGGAIYQGGTFNISGTAYIYPGDKKSNDVYLAGDGTIEGGKTVNVTATWSGSQSDSSPMSITPSELKRGRIVLGGSKYTSNYTKFAVTTTEWSVGFNQGTWTLDDDLMKRIGAELWVAGKGKNGNSVTLSEGVGDPSDDNLGTKSAPYASIKKAVQQCWTMDRYFWINVDGTVYGKQQVVPAANTTAKSGLAKEFKIVGFKSNATIDRGLSGSTATSEGSALKIETTTATVTLGTLKITGGNTTGEGGGIYSCKTAPTISLNEVEISGNTAAVNGGGIYFEGSSGTERLTLQTTATIKGNTASNYGGGVYIKNANMTMTTKALIGDNSAFDTGATESSKSNIADIGGGVYAATANVYIGYGYNANTSKYVVAALTDGYGICYNYAKSTSLGGGGIYISSDSAMYMGSGKISKNGTATYGGGIYNAGTVYLHTNALVGDARDSDSAATSEANSNTAKYGGGIYNSGTLYLGHNGTEDTSLGTGKGIVGNYASLQGGGLYNGLSTAYIKSGYVKSNRAGTTNSALGGGIYVSNGTVEMSGGTIAKNTAGDGGGVCVSKNFTMSGGVIGDTSSAATPIDSNPVTYSNYALNNGGGIYCLTGSTVSITGGIIQRNFARNGGGIYYAGGTFGLSGGSILYNASDTSYGGGLYLASTSATLTSGTIKGNKSYKGGGIYTANGSKTTINGALALESNHAVPRGNTSTQGGAIYNTGELTISGAATFTSNTANGDQGSLTAATASGGAIFNSGTLIISGAVSMNSNSAKTKTGETKLTRGGAIYNSGTLTMSNGSIGTSGLNTAGSQGGAIYQCGTFNASGAINFYNAGNGATNNDVFLATDKCVNVTGSFSATPTGGKVMTITPGTYKIGILVATKDASLNNVASFTTSVSKMGLVKSGIYSSVELEETGGSTSDSGYVVKGVVGIDFTVVKPSDFPTSAWASVGAPDDGQEISGGLSYYCLKHSNGKYAVLKVNKSIKSATSTKETGVVSAKAVVFASATPTSQTIKNFTSASYDTSTGYQTSGSSMYAHQWIDCNVFGITLTSYDEYQHAWIQQPTGTYKLYIAYYTSTYNTTGTGITGFKVP